MPYSIKLTPSAIEDLNEAFIWYNEQVTDLGYRFIDMANERFNSLSITPKSGSIRYDDIRCALIRIFPYLIHYSVDDNAETVIIYRIFHISRKPLWETE